MAEPVRDVLFVVADEWHYEVLGTRGTPGVRTPNLDALARRSVVFDNHWCQASPCGPARSTLLTGTETTTHWQWTNLDPADHGFESLPEVARRAGLAPLLIGYTDTPRPAAAGAEALLYDPAFELIRPFFWQLGFPAYRRELASRGYSELSEEMMGIYPRAGEPTAEGLAPSSIAAADSDVAWLTDAAIETIRDRPEPQLLHLNWLRPHPPLVPPAPYHRLVDPDEVAPPNRSLTLDEQLASHPYFDLAGRNRPMEEYLQRRVAVEAIDDGDERRLRAAYYGLCAEVDHHLGRVLAELEAGGRDRSTLIVFVSDHGDALGDHWLYGRRGPFDDHFRVPCIIHDPRPEADATRGTTVEAFTGNVDIMATILDALQAPPPPTVDGRSLLPFLHSTPPTRWRSEIRLHMDWADHLKASRRSEVANGPQRFSVLRTDRHRYVEFTGLDPLLFDRQEDPGEIENRAGDPAYRTIQAELAAALTS